MVNGHSKLRNTRKLFARIAKNRQANADKFPNQRPYYLVGFRAQNRAILLRQAKTQKKNKFPRPTQVVLLNKPDRDLQIYHAGFIKANEERILAAKTIKCFQNALRVLHQAAAQNKTLSQFMSMAMHLMPPRIYKTITEENPDWYDAALLVSKNPDQEDTGYYSNGDDLKNYVDYLQDIFFDVNMQNSTQPLPGFEEWLAHKADRRLLTVAPSPFNFALFGVKH